MDHVLSSRVRTYLFRTSLITGGLLSIVAIAFFVYVFIDFFNHASYRFVVLFLLLIVLSNILAKISLAYMKA